ncbi:MAG: branched-chain amino acid ABC transporter substrate-binding protein, partial [Proteobacteria bacterium]|nr:branched-chain amino acid ABC transporter substrate-binding protein [Burkholderiales bacterium]
MLAVITTAALIAAGCSKEEPPKPVVVEAPKPAPEVTVRIGVAAPLTGPQAHLGKDVENGARLAIEEANGAGIMIGGNRVRFELVVEDDEASGTKATVVAQSFVDKKVAAVVGHMNSGASIPASKVYSDAGIPQVSPSATAVSYTAQGFKTAFRVMANDLQQGRVLGEYAVKQLAGKRIAIIDDRTAYGQGLADEFEKAVKGGGGNLVGREYTSDKATDFRAILTTIRGKKPDLLFYGGMDAQFGPMAEQVRTLKVAAQLLGGDGAQSAQFIKLGGAAAEGVIASSPGLPVDKMPGGEKFAEKFKAKFGEIQIYAPFAYDATWTLIDAMKAADSTEPAKILDALSKIERQGVTGPIAFDEKGDIRTGGITMYAVKGGAWQTIETIGGAPAAPAAAPMPATDPAKPADASAVP